MDEYNRVRMTYFEKCSKCNLIFTLQVLDLDKISYMDDGTEGDYYGMSKDNQTIGERDRDYAGKASSSYKRAYPGLS